MGSLLGFSVLPALRAEIAGDFNVGWHFHLGDVAGAEQADFDDSGWRRVDLPHDWSIELERDPQMQDGAAVAYLHGGVGWYRKTFTTTPAEAGRDVEVLFDGVQQESEVWINGRYLGLQPNGYIPFSYALGHYLRAAGQPNVIAVKAVNPERNSRWYAGSGIYRRVALRVRAPLHVATNGLLIDTLRFFEEKAGLQAYLQVRVEVVNESSQPEAAEVQLALQSPKGSVETFDLGRVQLAPNSHETVSEQVTIANPEVWTVETPRLYRAEVQLKQASQVVDSWARPIGIRTVAVTATEGFLLNGKSMKLRGACLHHDNGLLGAAAHPAAEWRRVALMKARGYTALRTSHNPPSAEFLDACDALGMLVIDEFADSWELPKKPNGYSRYFNAHAEDDLRAMVRRDFCHPSVVIWSIGNEIPERAFPAGVEISRRLIATIKRLDTRRPVTEAMCGFWDYPDMKDQWERTEPAFALLDVGGYNYLRDEYERDHAKVPTRVMLCTESFPKESYEYWRSVERLPYVIGDCVWTGMDHLGESGIGHSLIVRSGDTPAVLPWGLMPWPIWINGSGDIDLIGNQKTASLYRDVLWGVSKVEMAVHRPIPEGSTEMVGSWGWPDETNSWNWRGEEGKRKSVRVFSREPRVRLELNGQVVGEQAIDPEKGMTAEFSVAYSPGSLKATALGADGSILGTRMLTTTGKATRVVVAPEGKDLPARREQVIFVPLTLEDAEGRCVDDADATVSIELSGPVELLALGNGNPNSEGRIHDSMTKMFQGRALAILRATGKPGVVQVHAKAVDGAVAGEASFELR